MYKTVYKEVEVDIELSDFDDDDLLEELETRGLVVGTHGNTRELLKIIWLKRRQGQDYQRELDQLIYESLGHVL
jgi:hypothetical protein